MNEKGISLLYVMAALIVTGFIGTALLKMSHSDTISGVYYRQTDLARVTATSGITAGISKLENFNDRMVTLDILQKHVDANNPDTLSDQYIWLKGGNNFWDTLYKRQVYKTKILGFDYDGFNISLKSEAIGNGGKSSSISVYNIEGIGFKEIQTNNIIPTNAIQLDGDDNFEMNCSLVVHGSTYLGGKIVMNNKAPVFDGKFYMKGSGSVYTTFNKGVKFLDTTYIGGNATFNTAKSYFYSATGFGGYSKIVNASSMPQFVGNGNIFHNGGVELPWGKTLDLNNNNVHSYSATYKNGAINGNYLEDVSSNYNNVRNYTNPINIDNKLGFQSQPSIPFDTTVWENVSIKTMTSGQRISGSILNSWYNDALMYGDTLNGGFMVVRAPTSGTEPIGVSPKDYTPFTGKVLFIMKNSSLSLIDFYESSSTSNSVLYIEGGGISTTYMTNVNNFRGIIYVADGGMTIKAKNMYIRGAVYHADGAKHKYDNDGGNQLIDITYDPTVIQEASFMGIFRDPNDISNVTETKILEFTNGGIINLKLLSRSF